MPTTRLWTDEYHLVIPMYVVRHVFCLLSFLAFILISSFIALNFAYSESIIKYSSLDITPSSNAFEIYPLIVFSFASANILIFFVFLQFGQ